MITQREAKDDEILTRLAGARRMARDLQPYSPAWDAAMALVEDLEREAGYKWAVGGAAETVGQAVPA